MKCTKCGSSILVPMEHPFQHKGVKCIVCGKEVWYDQIDMHDFDSRHATVEIPEEIAR